MVMHLQFSREKQQGRGKGEKRHPKLRANSSHPGKANSGPRPASTTWCLGGCTGATFPNVPILPVPIWRAGRGGGGQSVGDPSCCAAGAVQLSPRPFVLQQRGAAWKADLLKLFFSSTADKGEAWERVPSLRETAGRGGRQPLSPSPPRHRCLHSVLRCQVPHNCGAVPPLTAGRGWCSWLVLSTALPDAV